MLGPERYRRNLSNSREWYDEQREFAEFVDLAASVEGFIADIARRPRGFVLRCAGTEAERRART